jgi:hypothetical protein
MRQKASLSAESELALGAGVERMGNGTIPRTAVE